MRSSRHASRASSSRAISDRAKRLELNSDSGSPRQSASASAGLPCSRRRWNRATSSSSSSTRSRYPGSLVTTRSLPTTFRRPETCTCSAFCAVSGGSSSQRASIRRLVETTLFASRRSIARSARCFAPPSRGACPQTTPPAGRGPGTPWPECTRARSTRPAIPAPVRVTVRMEQRRPAPSPRTRLRLPGHRSRGDPSLSAVSAAEYPHIPCTPPPGGVAAEQR